MKGSKALRRVVGILADGALQSLGGDAQAPIFVAQQITDGPGESRVVPNGHGYRGSRRPFSDVTYSGSYRRHAYRSRFQHHDGPCLMARRHEENVSRFEVRAQLSLGQKTL